jgi:hypothetical protein
MTHKERRRGQRPKKHYEISVTKKTAGGNCLAAAIKYLSGAAGFGLGTAIKGRAKCFAWSPSSLFVFMPTLHASLRPYLPAEPASESTSATPPPPCSSSTGFLRVHAPRALVFLQLVIANLALPPYYMAKGAAARLSYVLYSEHSPFMNF